ncbi:hypothetical protein CHELA20_40422 [Hyphomicrobiales bacterium]|nr:hypothetical protein CHELA20_40422 [Hyphomicrobiales bacterium]CAH1688625.1 hypothetical protein CHELA41_40278 [Hyphomicrobiales bacterium]
MGDDSPIPKALLRQTLKRRSSRRHCDLWRSLVCGPTIATAKRKPAKRGNALAGWGDESEFLSVGSEIDAFF